MIEAKGESREDLMRRGQQGELLYWCVRDLLWRNGPLKCKEVLNRAYFVPIITMQQKHGQVSVYATRRYGEENDDSNQAWDLLKVRFIEYSWT
ncbi:unnamed protein product, partial [Timema podura]|nr:unnamed protein product [Timema podura]